MKKLVLVFVLLYIVMVFSAFTPSAAMWNDDSAVDSAFLLPASLVVIECEAFEGTATESVILSDSVLIIGDRAFADSQNLKKILISESVCYIGEHTFDGVSNLAIYASCGSYAAVWAQEHNIAFVQPETETTKMETLRKLLEAVQYSALFFCCVNSDSVWKWRRRIDAFVRSMRPQDRCELYPIEYRFP